MLTKGFFFFKKVMFLAIEDHWSKSNVIVSFKMGNIFLK